MTGEEPPPPKPKPGSLRDRIAAFEAKPASTGPPPPAPRPKPLGNVQWKPKTLSPPSSPPAAGKVDTSGTAADHGAIRAGMSAADAKESIGMGGSLKERMAALKGKGAFGAPAPAPPPKPASDKPKWKPPPVVHTPKEEEVEEKDSTTEIIELDQERAKSPHVEVEVEVEMDADAADEEKAVADTEEAEAEADPEEEERQRRAAIAARMAKLGGARIGMGPPIIGAKPQVKKAVTPKEELKSPSEEKVMDDTFHMSTESIARKDMVHSVRSDKNTPPTDSTIRSSSDDDHEALKVEGGSPPTHIDIPKASSQSSLLSADSTSPASVRSPPTTMPVPAGPRRAGPPRKRPPKTPSESSTNAMQEGEKVTAASHVEEVKSVVAEPATIDEDMPTPYEEISTPVNRDISPPLRDENKLDEELVSEGTHADPYVHSEIDPPVEDEEAAESDPEPPINSEDDLVEDELPNAQEDELIGSDAPIASEAPEPEEEEDEATRRKRIADRIAKSGGFNPFTAPPPVPSRQSSTVSDHITSPSSAKPDSPISPSLPSTAGRKPSARGPWKLA